MAIRKVDSFDDTTNVTHNWYNPLGAVSLIGAYGRNGTNGWSSNGNVYWGVYTPPGELDSRSTWIMGAAFKLLSYPSANAAFFQVVDGGTTQIELCFSSTGLITVTKNFTVIESSTVSLSLDAFYYIEFKTTIHSSTGSYVVRVNEQEILNSTGQNTQSTGNATANIMSLAAPGRNVNGLMYVDDYYLLDNVDQSIAQPGSPPNNDFLGDIRVESIFPNGNGNTSNLVGSDSNSTDNYLLVDEANPNGDTDYVESATVGNKDTYTYGNLTATTATVYGVIVKPYARKTNAGTKKLTSITRLAGTEEDGDDKILSTDYQYLPDVRGADPSGAQWTVSNVNSAEFGVKVTV